MQQVLCFGDSNTWGYNPIDGSRYPWEIRWTGLLQEKLFDKGVRVVEEGLCGRTTIFEDALRVGRSGIKLLPVLLEAHRPDVLVIMLGTNDCKTLYGASAGVIAKGIEMLIKAAEQFDSNLKVLVVSPIHLKHGVGDEGFDPEFNENSVNVSHELAKEYKKVADKHKTAFLDASLIAIPSDADREHMDPYNHALLADAIEERVKELLA
ncbi:MAG: GDSL-type esterase/lipase family protein [Saccharofermentans sp.]|nr:GDSL-type esterase/lipase family protein [Saccharofermentans sp.]